MSFHPIRTTVLINDFSLHAFVGHHMLERNQPQVVSVGIACTLENPEVIGDDLNTSFDYVPIIEKVKVFAMSRKRRLIETFAEEIAEECFAHTRIKTVRVSVRKLNKLPAVAAVGTERTFERSH